MSPLYLFVIFSVSIFDLINSSSMMSDGNIDITDDLEKLYGVYGIYATEINDTDWNNLTSGSWYIQFYAPWCPACKDMNDMWDSVAKWGKDLDMTVGKIDVTKNPGLSGRFLVMSLPTIYHIKDGIFRLYKGERSEQGIISYIDDALYESEDPVPWYKSPNSLHMSALGTLFHGAMIIRDLHTTVTDDYGVPSWGTYIIFGIATVLIGLMLGLIVVCMCDHFASPARQHETPTRYSSISHNKKSVIPDNESDIVDDRETAEGLRKRTTKPDENS